MKILKTLINGIISLVLFGLLLIFLASIFTRIDNPFGYRAFIVQSGSMEPTIKTGSLSIAKSQSSYDMSDVIAFNKASDDTVQVETTLHRIVQKTENEKESTFVTKGDANNSSDQGAVTKNNIYGKILFSIPFLGYAVAFVKTVHGFILLMVLPALVLIVMELTSLKNEISKIHKNKKSKDKYNFVKYISLTLIALFLGSFVPEGISALYSDEEKSSATIQTAVSFAIENDGESLTDENDKTKPEVLLYSNDDKNEVGFVLNNVGDYDAFEYTIQYSHETEFGQLTEVIEGKIENSEYAGTTLEEWIPLGTESSGGVVVYHEGVEQVTLNVDLIISDNVEMAISDTINFI